MANTLGGVIVVGVAEDAQAKPQLPALGMEFKRGLVEQVMSKCVDNITPPIIPEIVECVNDAQELSTPKERDVSRPKHASNAVSTPSCSLASSSAPHERRVSPPCTRQSDAGADSPDGARC